MKTKILIYTIFLFSLHFAFAQEVIIPLEERIELVENPSNTYYYKDVNGALNKYVGTWKYETSTEVFEITFSLNIHSSAGKDFKDELISKFKYTRNGVVIYNTYTSLRNYNISGGFFKFPNNTNKIKLYYSEPDVTYRTIQSQLELEYVPSTTLGGANTLIWKRKIFQDSPTPPPFELPKNMTLVKQ